MGKSISAVATMFCTVKFLQEKTTKTTKMQKKVKLTKLHFNGVKCYCNRRSKRRNGMVAAVKMSPYIERGKPEMQHCLFLHTSPIDRNLCKCDGRVRYYRSRGKPHETHRITVLTTTNTYIPPASCQVRGSPTVPCTELRHDYSARKGQLRSSDH